MKRRTFKKLVMFCTRPRVCPEMKAEVVKQAAREVVFDHGMDLKITPGVSITRYWSIIILIKNSSIL